MPSPEDAEREYRAFLAAVRNDEVVWALRNDVGYANWKPSDEEQGVVPFWSSEERARACAATTFPGYAPTPVDAGTFRNLLELIEEQDLFVGVNLTVDMAGIDIRPDEFRRELGPE